MQDMSDPPLDGPVEYDPEAEAHRARYNWQSPVPLTTAIVEIVAEVEGIDPRDVGRLTDGIDPEALDSLFAPVPMAGSRREGQVSFVFHGHHVTVSGTGDIEVRSRSTE